MRKALYLDSTSHKNPTSASRYLLLVELFWGIRVEQGRWKMPNIFGKGASKIDWWQSTIVQTIVCWKYLFWMGLEAVEQYVADNNSSLVADKLEREYYLLTYT